MISKDIDLAAAILNNNGIIGFPTETVYGLAGNIYSKKAIQKIYSVKGRPHYNPLIVHIKSVEYLENIAEEIPEKAIKLADEFWPGPLTLLLKKKPHIPDYVTANKQTVAVRIPNHHMAVSLLQKLPFPLAAPSANPFSRISPTCAEHVYEYFGDTIKLILDGGECSAGIESTIVGFENEEVVIYRLGAISQESIESVVGSTILKTKDDHSPDAPGMFSKHYSPLTELYLTDNVEGLLNKFSYEKIGLLLFKNKVNDSHAKAQIVLSDSGSFNEAARNLYASMHELDSMDLDIIIAEKFPDEGLGKAINDRLKRAAFYIKRFKN